MSIARSFFQGHVEHVFVAPVHRFHIFKGGAVALVGGAADAQHRRAGFDLQQLCLLPCGRPCLDALHRLAAFAAVLLLEQRVQRFAQILRFNDELIDDKHHTREHFIEILAIIDAYEDYCRSHPDYKNNRCICAVANIKRVYNERLQKHDFS